MATVDSGDMIIKLNTIEISILIKTGCNSVKLLIILPIPVVIICTYGSINTPIVAEIPPTIVGYTIKAILPTRCSINKINNTAIDAVIIVLIKSPIPAITHVPFLNCAAPLPTYEALATTAIAKGVRLNFNAIKAPTSAGTVN